MINRHKIFLQLQQIFTSIYLKWGTDTKDTDGRTIAMFFYYLSGDLNFRTSFILENLLQHSAYEESTVHRERSTSAESYVVISAS